MKQVWKVGTVASWPGWCSPCHREDRPLVLTRSGPAGVRAWLRGLGDDDRCLLLTCRLCGQWQVVPLREEDDPVILVEDETYDAVADLLRAASAVPAPPVVPVVPAVPVLAPVLAAAELTADLPSRPPTQAVPAPDAEPATAERALADDAPAHDAQADDAPAACPAALLAAFTAGSVVAARTPLSPARPPRLEHDLRGVADTLVAPAPLISDDVRAAAAAVLSTALQSEGSRGRTLHRGARPRRSAARPDARSTGHRARVQPVVPAPRSGEPATAAGVAGVPSPARPTSIALPVRTTPDLVAGGYQVVVTSA